VRFAGKPLFRFTRNHEKICALGIGRVGALSPKPTQMGPLGAWPPDAWQGFHAGGRESGIGDADGKHGLYEFTQTHVVYLQT